MNLSPLTAVSPIDGRYFEKTNTLGNYFSEFALIRYRVLIEVEYFIKLSKTVPQLKEINNDILNKLPKIYTEFSIEDAQKIKETEKVTNHDIKAVEYFVKNSLKEYGLEKYLEFVHFGLTSQDVNNTAVPLSLKHGVESILIPQIDNIINRINDLSKEWDNIPMLAKTHGQPASPTKVGKEFRVFVERLNRQTDILKQTPFYGKFGGATGNFNAHLVAYPNIDWVDFGNKFLSNLGLVRQQTTTQIEHYDMLAAVCDNIKRINTILLDFNRDIWTYISMNYFKQKIKKGEVGSSAMPHKVNPIDFENSEGNIGIANAIFEHLSSKLPVSRLQRDLTDSTVLRNIGVPLAHTLIALSSTLKGLSKLEINIEAITDDLNNNWAVIAEAIQTILRRELYPQPYEALKGLTRKNEKITKESIHEFIEQLEVSDSIKNELKNITPFNYIGV